MNWPPLLVLDGTSDVNVPYLRSVRLIDELLENGKGDLVSFMTCPGEFRYFTREQVLRDAWRRSRSFATAMRQPSRYSIGGSPTARVKRSKNAERESAAVFASWATVHERAS